MTFGGDMPIRQSVARSRSFLKQFPPGTENFSTELSALDAMIDRGARRERGRVRRCSTAWEQILSGGTSPSAGMAQMESRCNQLLAQKVRAP